MNRQQKLFIKKFVTEIQENNAAIFAGAGLSAPAGYVNWKDLLREITLELGLDVDKETDLVGVAQYSVNKRCGNMHHINQLIIDNFNGSKKPTTNHKILARLPISTYWTTNYDKLIETSLESADKIVDSKCCIADLATTIKGRDAIVYKMHGDVSRPDEAILTRNQYEKYYLSHGAFTNALSGDLISKTFLFLGFSFTDPNINYILSRIRVTFQNNQRTHYCIMKRVSLEECDSKDLGYQRIKQDLFIEDLLRYNIETVLVDSYSDITQILSEIERRHNRKTVYISGSAHEYGNYSKEEGEEFVSNLSKALVKEGYKIVSGFGLGVGSSVISGALSQIYMEEKKTLKSQLVLRPFPQGNNAKKLWTPYREDMISYSGISIFLFGNKINDKELVLANGVKEEFNISKTQGNVLIPLGGTGYMAKELWNELMLDESFTNNISDSEKTHYTAIGDDNTSLDDLIEHTIELIKIQTK